MATHNVCGPAPTRTPSCGPADGLISTPFAEEDGDTNNAEDRKFELLESSAPDPWINNAVPKDDAGFKAAGYTALEWLKGALLHTHESFPGHASSPLTEKVLELLGTNYFTANLDFMDLFAELKVFAAIEGPKAGKSMHKYFTTACLKGELGALSLPPYKGGGGIVSQEQFIEPSTLDCSLSDDKLPVEKLALVLGQESFESEAVYMHVLRMVAVALDDQFQALLKKLAVAHEAVAHEGASLKTIARMWKKLQTKGEHRDLPVQWKREGLTRRSGQNADINRCSVVFEDPTALKDFVMDVSRIFGGGHAVNMFALDDAAAERHLHYRTFTMNVVWPPADLSIACTRTVADLEEQSRFKWDMYQYCVPNDPTFSPSQWLRHATAARGHLNMLAAGKKPLRFLMEIQVILKPHHEGRKQTYLFEKLLRSETAAALAVEFKKSTATADAGRKQSSVQKEWAGKAQVAVVSDNVARGGHHLAKQTRLLNHASRSGYHLAVEILLEAGTRANITDREGRTPLFFASRDGHITVATALLANGAVTGKARNDGTTPLHVASQNGHVDVVAGEDKAACCCRPLSPVFSYAFYTPPALLPPHPTFENTPLFFYLSRLNLLLLLSTTLLQCYLKRVQLWTK